MKPARFEYLAPNSPNEAVEQLAAYAGEARCLSGGQSLIPLMNYRLVQPAALIDLNRCAGLSYIHTEGSELVIGPMTRQADVENSETVRSACPLVAKTMVYLGSPAIRNRGTIGGTLAHADRTAELPAVAIALEATLVAQGPQGLRNIVAEEFFLGDLTTALEADEMLREVRFPVSPENSRSAFVEVGNRHHDLALAGIAAYLECDDGGRVETARIACIGIGPQPIRFRSVEMVLCGGSLTENEIADAARLAGENVEPESDIHASAEYRRSVLSGLVSRALHQAVSGGPAR